jgi:hypothetical protein
MYTISEITTGTAVAALCHVLIASCLVCYLCLERSVRLYCLFIVPPTPSPARMATAALTTFAWGASRSTILHPGSRPAVHLPLSSLVPCYYTSFILGKPLGKRATGPRHSYTLSMLHSDKMKSSKKIPLNASPRRRSSTPIQHAI